MANSGKHKKIKHKKLINSPNLKNDNVQLSDTKLKKWIVKAVEMLKDNYPATYIRQHIALNKEGVVNTAVIDRIITAANAEIGKEYFTKQSEITALHLKRYNKQIKKLREVKELDQDMIDSAEEGGISYEDWMKSREKKIKAVHNTFDTMFQKERLLGIHNKNFNFNFNQTETIKEVKTTKKIPNIHKLSFEQQVKLYELLMKAKEDENEMISVKVVNQETKVEHIEDIEAEVIEQANVELIKQETVKELPAPKPLTNADPTARLRESLAKIAAEKLKKHGANLDNMNTFKSRINMSDNTLLAVLIVYSYR
jgi:hypothetical protein